MINQLLVFLLAFTALPAFSAQHAAVRPKSIMDSGDQATIKEVIEMERQAKEASLRRDADFSQRTLAEDYVAITPLGQVTTKQDTVSARKSGQLRYDNIDVTDMPSGGKLTLETSNVTLDDDYARQLAPLRPGDYVMIAISDTGIGMEISSGQLQPSKRK